MKHGDGGTLSPESWGSFGQSFIGKIISSKRSKDGSHHPIYLLSVKRNEGRADKDKLGQLLIQSFDKIKFLSETWGFPLYQISTGGFSTQDITE